MRPVEQVNLGIVSLVQGGRLTWQPRPLRHLWPCGSCILMLPRWDWLAVTGGDAGEVSSAGATDSFPSISRRSNNKTLQHTFFFFFFSVCVCLFGEFYFPVPQNCWRQVAVLTRVKVRRLLLSKTYLPDLDLLSLYFVFAYIICILTQLWCGGTSILIRKSWQCKYEVVSEL